MSVTTGDCCEKCKEKAAGCLDVLLTLIRIKNHKETARHMNDKKIDPVKKSPNKSPTRHSISRQHPEGEELERVLDTESMSTLKTFDERHWSDMDKFELEVFKNIFLCFNFSLYFVLPFKYVSRY